MKLLSFVLLAASALSASEINLNDSRRMNSLFFGAPLPARMAPLKFERAIPALPKALQDEEKKWGDEEVEKLLKGTGAVGLIHGGIEKGKAYLFAAHDPEDFFNFKIYPLRPSSKEIAEKIEKLKLERHDIVRVTGKLEDSPAHISVTGIELVKADPVDFSNQKRDLKLPLEFEGKTEIEITALVHGVLRGGKQVALEYKNHILPLSLEEDTDEKAAAELNKLWRGDAVKLTVKVRRIPKFPVHLIFDASKGVTVLESVRDFQEKEVELQGPLVVFRKSPITRMDVWAVEIKSAKTGVTRYFTLNNFSDMDKWKAMNADFEKEWSARKESEVQSRNKFTNSKLHVSVKGTVLTLSEGALAQNQANQTVEVSQYTILPQE